MTVEDLPKDLDLCHQLILKLAADNEHLGRRLQELLRNKFGRKSETINPDQLNLFAREILTQFQQSTQEENKPANITPSFNKEQKHGGGGRNTNRPNLPVETKEYTLPETELPCPQCKELRTEIGYESAQELEFDPASFKIIKHVQKNMPAKAARSKLYLLLEQIYNQ
jgi:hypothetical protein